MLMLMLTTLWLRFACSYAPPSAVACTGAATVLRVQPDPPVGDQSCDRKWNLKTPLRSSSGRSASCRENERWRATVAGGVAVWLLLFLLSMQQVRASTCWRLIGAVIDGGRRPQPATQHKVAHLSPRCICMLAARLWQFVSTPAAAPRRKRTDQSGL